MVFITLNRGNRLSIRWTLSLDIWGYVPNPPIFSERVQEKGIIPVLTASSAYLYLIGGK